MTHHLHGVILTMLVGLTGQAIAPAQGEQPDPVERAMRGYQVKVDQLERLTKRVLSERKQQLDDAKARSRKHQDEIATLKRRLQTVNARNQQLDAQVSDLRSQLRTATTERETRAKTKAKTGAKAKAKTRTKTKAETEVRTRAPDQTRARLHRLEDQAAHMEQWIQRLQRDIRSLRLARRARRGRGL